ncbi:hypothetical protein M3Y94_00004200 [Aphelenchoides besseyi]|nr:hypothetical protein M3Y94_00004200 [Aphelenchoides besseyi]
MLRFLVLSMFIFEVYGNNPCIQTIPQRGFRFNNCTDVAEVALKWKKETVFKLTLKDLCVLEFEGKGSEYAKWTDKHGKVTNCFSIAACRFEVKNGKLYTLHDHMDLDCFNVRNQLDSEWSWTKVRLENSINCRFEITTKGKYDEAFEYELPTTKSVLPKTTAKPSSLSKFSVKTVESFGLILAVVFIGL